MLVSLPNPLTDGTTAYGSHVKADLDAIVTVTNGGIDNDNARTNADAAGKGFTTDKLANSAVTTAKIADRNVTGVKLKGDGTAGEGANLSELATQVGFDNTSNYPPTNIVGARKQQGGTSVWCYFTLSATTRFKLDDSIDWRQRLIFVEAVFINSTGAAKANLPGGGTDSNMRGSMWTVLTDLTGLHNSCGFYSQDGSTDGEATPFGTLVADLLVGGATPVTQIRLSAAATTGGGITAGNLTVKVPVAPGFETSVTSIDCIMLVSCSPKIE